MPSIWNKPKSQGGPSHKKGVAAKWHAKEQAAQRENPQPTPNNKNMSKNETRRIVLKLRSDPTYRYMYGLSNNNPENNLYKGFLPNGGFSKRNIGKTRRQRQTKTRKHKGKLQ